MRLRGLGHPDLRRRTTCWRTAVRGRRKGGHLAAFPEGHRRTDHADELPPPARAGRTTDGRRWRHPHPTRHGEVDETEVDEATHGWTERTETGPSPARGRRRRTPSQQPLHLSRPPKRRNRKWGRHRRRGRRLPAARRRSFINCSWGDAPHGCDFMATDATVFSSNAGVRQPRGPSAPSPVGGRPARRAGTREGDGDDEQPSGHLTA